jgi:hypothetical protein
MELKVSDLLPLAKSHLFKLPTSFTILFFFLIFL